MKDKNSFLRDVVTSNSVKNIYYSTLFPKIDEYKSMSMKDEKDWSEIDIKILLHASCVGNSYNSVNVKVSLLKKYLKYLGNTNTDFINQDVIYALIVDSNKEESIRYISKDELYHLIKRLDNYDDRLLCSLMRIGIGGKGVKDIINLKVSDIDFDNKCIRIKDVTYNIDDETIELIENTINQDVYIPINASRNIEYRINKSSPYLFKPCITRTKVSEKHTQYSIRAKMQKIRDLLDNRIKYENLSSSGIVDSIISYQNTIGRELSLSEISKYVKDNFGISKNPYNLRLIIRKVCGNHIGVDA